MSSAYAFFQVAPQHLPQTRKRSAQSLFSGGKSICVTLHLLACVCPHFLSWSLSLSLGSIWPCLRPRVYRSNRWVLFLTLKGVPSLYFSLLHPHFLCNKVQAQGGKLRAKRTIAMLTHRREKKLRWSERMIISFNHITVAFKELPHWPQTYRALVPSLSGLTSEVKKRY